MKKFILFFLIISGLNSFGQVFSKPFGFMTVDLEPHKIYLLGMPFDNTNTFNNILSQLPEESMISTWNKAISAYSSFRASELGMCSENIKRGEAFYIKVEEPVKLKLYGEVPQQEISKQIINRGINLLGLTYPTHSNLTEEKFFDELLYGAFICIWDNENQIYKRYIKSRREWLPSEVIISPEQGFWIVNRGKKIIWETTKPYSYP